jgi:hypothetical protein
MTRFLKIAGAFGYLLSLSVIGIGIASLFIHEDIEVSMAGPLAPKRVSLELVEDAAVAAYLVAPGTHVNAGDPVAEVVTDPAAIKQALAHHRLEEALELAAEASEKPVASLETSLEEIPLPTDKTTLSAIESGVFQPSALPWKAQAIPAGEPIATLCNTTVLVLDAQAPAGKGRLLEAGQRARVFIPSQGAVERAISLEGVVERASDEDADAHIRLRFDSVPEEVRSLYRTLCMENPASTHMPECKARVVVGRQTLFRKLFSPK